jgi:hypothetical protein
MRVKGWSNGQGTYGVRVGFPNRRAFFDEEWTQIEVEIEGEVHQFALSGGFWRRCPEFRDRGAPVLREWMQRHYTLNWPKRAPPSFELIPLGGNRFRLDP